MPRKAKPKPRQKRAVTATSASTSPRYAWGIAAIAAQLGRTPNVVDWMLRRNQIKSARKVGDRWVVDIEQLHREMRGEVQS
jgi:hypothetical protein